MVELPLHVRASTYRLIAGLLLEEVNERTLELLREPSVRHVFETLSPGCGDYLDKQWDEATFDAAAADYCELFVLPGGVSPFAVAWTEGDPSTNPGQWAAHIQEAYAVAGLELGDSSIPPDHIAAILVLYAAIDDTGEVESTILIDKGLLDDWILRFAQRLESITQNPLYLAVARLLRTMS